MKNLILIICLLSLNTIVFSQDSIKIRTEIDTFNSTNYVGEYAYQFAKKEARKSLFKIDMFPNVRGEWYAYEPKLAKDISVNISLNGSISLIPKWQYGLTDEKGSIKGLGISIEPRWYYTMRKDIKKGLIADNLEGNYLGIRQNFNRWLENFKNQPSTQLIYGIQQRILNDRFIDINLGAGLKYDPETPSLKTAKFAFSYRLSFGVLIDKTFWKNVSPLNKKIESAVNKDILQVFESENHVLKIDILSLFRELNDYRWSSKIGIAYEQRIGQSAWTIDTRLSYEGFSPLKKSESGIEVLALKSAFQAGIMPRYYVGSKNKSAIGLASDNISGVYFGLNTDLNYGEFDSSWQDKTQSKVRNVRLNPVIGLQKHLLEHMYFDLWYGYGLIQQKIDNKAAISNLGSVLNVATGLVF